MRVTIYVYILHTMLIMLISSYVCWFILHRLTFINFLEIVAYFLFHT